MGYPAFGKKTVDDFGKKTDVVAMIETANLTTLADAYLNATGVKDVTLSFWVFNDSKKLAALRGGADITVSRFNAALRWFSDNWPVGAAWPAGVARPALEAAE